MVVPQNSPVHSTVDPVNQSYPLPGVPVFGKPASLPQLKRHRAPTFPGANPPNLTFFEGSKKSDWSTYSSDSRSNSQWSEEQKSGSPKHSNRTATTPPSTCNLQTMEGNSHTANSNRRFDNRYASQDVRNLPNPVNSMQQQPYQGRYQGMRRQENQYPYHSNDRSPPGVRVPLFTRSRKQHLARPTMIEPAIRDITWVERRSNKSDMRRISGDKNFDSYLEPLSSVDSASLSPASTSTGMVRSSSPLIVTSTPLIVESVHEPSYSDSLKPGQVSSLYSVSETRKSRFTFNPKAEDFVLVRGIDSSEVSEADEYVGFYLNPEVASPCSPKASTTPFMYDCDPMAWQVPDSLTQKTQSLKSCRDGDCSCSNLHHPHIFEESSKEFIGKVPGNMNWEKKFTPVANKGAHVKHCVTLSSKDMAEGTDTTAEGEAITILDKHQVEVDAVLELAEDHIIPEIKTREVTNVEFPHIIESEPPVEDSRAASLDESTQTITNNVQFFEDGSPNMVKFPECVAPQPVENLSEATNVDPEQASDIRESDGEDELFGDAELIVKLPKHVKDIQVDVKSLNWAEDTEISSQDTGIAETCGTSFVTGATLELKAKRKSKAKSKKTKSKAKSRNKLEPTLEARPKVVIESLPEPITKLQHQAQPDAEPEAKQEVKAEVNPRVENFFQEAVLDSEIETELKTQVEQETIKESSLVPEHKTEVVAEDKLSSKDVPAPDLHSIPDLLIKDTKVLKVLNYRDALLKKVTNPQTSIAPLPKVAPPKPNSQKATTSSTIKQQNTTRTEIPLPPSETGGRRKFFLHPIPKTATYDSVTQQLKGGMLEDIYISGLSPHPSAWKGPKGEPRASRDVPHDISWYAHVSFYSMEGASRFWELVQSGKGYSGPYQSRYGGFDDQDPGFFFLDGVRVLVNWRHNDQRVVNPLTVKAVTEEKATRRLLLTFNSEAALGSRNMTHFLAITKESEKGEGFAFIKKVVADIETWGQADSNLQGIRLLDEVLEQATPNPTASFTNKPPPRQVKVLVNFIKLLTAAKIKKYLSSRPEYGQDGFCRVEYYKDECDEPIDTFKAIREAKIPQATEEYGAEGMEFPVTKHTKQTVSEPRLGRRFVRTEVGENVAGEKDVVEGIAKVEVSEENVGERREAIVKGKELLRGGKKKSQST